VTGRWGKAGQRLSEQEIAARAAAAVTRRNQARARREADDAVAYRLWQAGELRPYRITWALNAKGLFGPEVDAACGAAEPDVDLWEAGKLYPTWEQVLLLAELTGKTARFLCIPDPAPLTGADTSLRFHGFRDSPEPLVVAFPPEVVAATVSKAAGT
jgi:hypothetical protein